MTSQDVEQQRRAIDAAVEGKTLCDLLERNATRFSDKPASSWKVDGRWDTKTWGQVREEVKRLTLGLSALGVGKGDFVALMARNRPEHITADLAVIHAGGTPVSLYNTLAPDQIQYVVSHCEATVAIVEDAGFMERFEKVKPELPNLQRVVMIEGAGGFSEHDWVSSWDDVMAAGEEALKDDPEAFDRSWKQVRPEDLATLIYTSGTTGDPKGVAITQRNALWTAEAGIRAVESPMHARGVSYLPIAHSAERLFSYYVGMNRAAYGYYCPEILQVFEYMPEVKPYAFLGVPRVWEKLQAGIVAKLAEEPDDRKRKIGEKAFSVAREVQRRRREGRPIPLLLNLQYMLFDKLVFGKVRAALGLDECEVPISGAAPISVEVVDFFRGIGIPLVEGYGLTETTAGGTIGRPQSYTVGTVGQALPGVEFKLLDDGELVMRGGCVTEGYYKEPELTAASFREDGWFHTGDVAEIASDGSIKIVDRKKELIITAGGKNISPANLEGLLKQHPLIGQACAVGDQRKFISALIVLDAEVAPGWGAKNGVGFTDIASFSRDPRVHEEIERAVEDANQHVSNVEKVKRFHILPTEWTPESEELTPTMKLKRRVILEKYSDEIEQMYSGAGRANR